MDHRERVWHALHHQQPDRPPLDFGARPAVVARLVREIGVSGTAELLDTFGTDFRYIEPREVVFDRARYIGPALRMSSDGSWEDIWGVRRVAVDVGGDTYEDVCYSPLAEAATVEEVELHRWPSADWYDYTSVPAQCREHSRFSRIGGGWGAVFGDAYRLQGMARFLENLIERPLVVEAIVAHVEAFYRGVNERIFDAAEGGLDIYYMGNDFGSQSSLLMSPDAYRHFFGPAIARLARQAKERGMAVMFHSCGAISDLIPDLIAAGVDILDPIQSVADGMDPVALKAQFGGQICLHGGVDTQHLLPHASLAAVTARVRQLSDLVGAGGGYILAPDQLLQADVPTATVLALYAAAGMSA